MQKTEREGDSGEQYEVPMRTLALLQWSVAQQGA